MKKLKIGLYSTLALLVLSSCSQQNDTSTEQTTTPPESSSQTTTTDTFSSDTTEDLDENDEIVADDTIATDMDTSETPALGTKPASTSQVETLYFGEVYDIYQGQAEKIEIEEFTLSEDGLEVEGGDITETVEDYLALVMLFEDKTTTFYVTEETQFNEEANSKENWLNLFLEAHELGFKMHPTQFDIEITYSEDEYGNYYIDYAEISTSDKYTDSPAVDTSSIEYTDSATVKIRYIFAVGDDLMTITTFEGERSDDSKDIDYRISENTVYSSLDSSILDAQVKDTILANGSNLSDDLEMLCNLYWNDGDTHNDYQNLAHIELVSFG